MALARSEIYRISMNEDGTPDTDTLMRLTENEVGVNGFFGANAFGKCRRTGKTSCSTATGTERSGTSQHVRPVLDEGRR